MLFIGDSITDCGRRDRAAPYGDGYVSLVAALLQAELPSLAPVIVNKGIGGDTVRDLAARWERDVEAERPDVLSVMIGINDVWWGFSQHQPERAVPIEEYGSTLASLLDRSAAMGAQLVVMEPYMIQPSGADPMRTLMDQYGAVARQTGTARGATIVQTQRAFDRALLGTTPAAWAFDRIHPHLAGHALIALAWLRAVGIGV